MLKATAAAEKMIPEHIRTNVLEYVTHGAPMGDFLEAVICNDLRSACHHADAINQQRLIDIVGWFYNYAPAPCWGSRQAYTRWMTLGGMQGISAQQAPLPAVLRTTAQEMETDDG
jgi:hypothetical protein